MATEDYERLSLTWEGRTIEVSYQANWLNTGQWHLELRCSEPLPVTTTGYRSAFLAAEAIEEVSAIKDFVLAWLTEAATDPAWVRALEEARQLKLF